MPRPSKNIDNLSEIDIPMQCFSCGKVIAQMPNKWSAIEKTLTEDEKNHKNKNGIIMDKLGLKCMSCRMTVYSHILYQNTTS